MFHLCSQNPFALKKIILLYILEISIGVNFQFSTCRIICHDNSMGMHLQATDSPHMVHGLLDAMTKGAGLIVTIHHNHHLLGIHHCTYSDSKGCFWNQIYVIIKETAVGNNCISSQSFLTGTALKAGTWLIESDMTVGANATHEEVNAACGLNGFLIVLALCLKVLGIAIEDMDILFLISM